MKRIISLLLAVSMVLSMFVTVFAATTYPDLVGDNAVYAAAVDALTELKVVNGFPDGQFKPGDELTRAELAKMLVVCLGLGEQVDALATRTVFSDVPATHWAAGYINAAAQSKVIIGYPDGTFKPEQNVSYAEAFTMALRALGYGNVVEAEGTWPTAYMLKAVELELTDDLVGEIKPAAASLRGNTAILLWNMLRTPMWRITEESEKNGMTLSDFNQRIMLNVKFPDYLYLEDVYVVDVDVKDKDEVKVTIGPLYNEKEVRVDETAKIKETDLTKIVKGMKVTVLEKNYKDDDKKTFLTLTPANTIVAGFVTDLKTEKTKTTFKVDGTEYRFADNENTIDLELNDYVVFEAESKKVVYNNNKDLDWFKHVIMKLPVKQGDSDIVAKYATSTSVIEDDIGEDDLVVVNGEWTTRDDVSVGGVYTWVDEYGYWLANNKSETKTFDQTFRANEEWNAAKVPVDYISLDDTEYVYFMDNFTAKKGSANKDNVLNKPATKEGLAAKPRDNDYTGNDVEVFTDALGVPVRLHFGDVDANSKNGGFYAIVSNGFWGDKDGKGTIKSIGLANKDMDWNNDAEPLQTTNKTEFYNKTDIDLDRNSDDYYAQKPAKTAKALFAWAKLDDDGNIESFAVLDDTLKAKVSGEIYQGKYDIVDASKLKVSSNKVTIDGQEYKISSSAILYESRPMLDDKEKSVEGFEVSFPEREEYNDTTLPENTLVAIDPTTKYIKYVFIAGDSESALKVGKVTSNVKNGKISINNESIELEDDVEADKDALVGYTTNKDGNKGRIKFEFDLEDIDEAYKVETPARLESDDTKNTVYVTEGDGQRDIFDLEDGSDDRKEFKSYKVYAVTLGTTKVMEDDVEMKKLKVTSVEEIGKGLDALKEASEEYARILVLGEGNKYDEDARIIFVFKPFDENQYTEGGYMMIDNGNKPDQPDNPEVLPSDPAPIDENPSDPTENTGSDPKETEAEPLDVDTTGSDPKEVAPVETTGSDPKETEAEPAVVNPNPSDETEVEAPAAGSDNNEDSDRI